MPLSYDLTTFYILGQKFVKFFVVFLENLRHQKDILRLTDLYVFQLFVGNKNLNCFNEKFLTVCDTLFPFLSSTRSSMAITNQANSCECRLIFEYVHTCTIL